MSLFLYDVQAGFGGFKPGQRSIFSATSLNDALCSAGIKGALVRIEPEERDFDFMHSNELLYQACSEHPHWRPCPVGVPDLAGEAGGADQQVADAIKNNAGAITLRPVPDYWLAEPWACKDLMQAMAERQLPAFCLEKHLPLPTMAKLAQAFPDNSFILAGVGYRSLRTLLPMIKTFTNIYLSIGNNFSFHGGIELFHKLGMTKQLLFGTGLPTSEAGAAIGQLTYANVSKEVKQAIAADNLQRLLREIKK